MTGIQLIFFVQLKPGTYKEVYMPISPQVEKGTITVKLRVMSQISSQDFNVDLEILVANN